MPVRIFNTNIVIIIMIIVIVIIIIYSCIHSLLWCRFWGSWVFYDWWGDSSDLAFSVPGGTARAGFGRDVAFALGRALKP